MSDGGSSLILIVAVFAVMYFMLIRPQNKQRQKMQQLLSSLEEGMDVITIGGLHGTIEDVTDEYVDLLVTDDVVLRYRRSAVAEVVSEVESEDVTVDAEADAEESEDT